MVIYAAVLVYVPPPAKETNCFKSKTDPATEQRNTPLTG